ncbi:MAG: hypothetical protein AB1730_07420 [Myxococcota bacterium]|jgi:hypothetical protein
MAARVFWTRGALLPGAMGLLGLVRTVQQLVAGDAGGGAGMGPLGMGALLSLGLLALAVRAFRKAQPPMSARRGPPNG